MNPELKIALSDWLLAAADDELILGHRNSEWCGHAPIIEEDIAFANLALDEIGHALAWYSLLAELVGEDRDKYPNWLVYHRDALDFRCAQVVELPKGDWAFSMLRQYLFDAAEKVRLDALVNSSYQPIAETAAKLRGEESYHFRHVTAWVRRLGLGTEESNRRMQRGLDELWPVASQLMHPLPNEVLLTEAGMMTPCSELAERWRALVIPFLHECDLKVPETKSARDFDRQQHSAFLVPLVKEMQEVARLFPDAGW
jgi:ring-1,2-phenylacetyl-CoA epoxidase subunit PaaC